MRGSSMAKLLAELSNDDDDNGPAVLPAAAVARLREAAERFAAQNPFKIGDLVTPRQDAPLRGAGKPHLVVSILPGAQPAPMSDNWTAGCVFNVQMISIKDGSIAPHLAPHWALELYTEK